VKLIKFTLIALVAFFFVEAKAQDEWKTADKNVIRLSPKEFTQLPKQIVKDLENRGCIIPQSYAENKKHNVIRGEFRQKGQKDWAILCSQKRISSILIYWNGSIKKVSRISPAEDSTYLQKIDKEKIGFSRIIDVSDAKYIYDHYKAYGGPKPPKITHDGIIDAYAEKASTVLYYHRGKWMELQGAD
jgi:hypothetical protein